MQRRAALVQVARPVPREVEEKVLGFLERVREAANDIGWEFFALSPMSFFDMPGVNEAVDAGFAKAKALLGVEGVETMVTAQLHYTYDAGESTGLKITGLKIVYRAMKETPYAA